MPAGIDRGGLSVPAVDDTLEASALVAARLRDWAATFASEAAFRAFYDRALPAVYGYLVRRCGNDVALAEDLAQTTFIEAVRRRASFDGRSDPLTWVTGIARHKLIDAYRRQARDEQRQMRLEVRELELDGHTRPWREVDDGEHLGQVLGRLPALQRAALVLHYADGLPVREVAHRIQRSEKATESLLTRGRVALRRAWVEVGDD